MAGAVWNVTQLSRGFSFLSSGPCLDSSVKAVSARRRIMWTCQKCGERLEDSFESCWKCSTLRPDIAARRAADPPETPKWRLAFQIFRSGWISWEELLKQAADFANELGPE